MAKSKFPGSIARMIDAAYNRGWDSREIAKHVNGSRVAKNLKVRYSVRTIAAKIANINR